MCLMEIYETIVEIVNPVIEIGQLVNILYSVSFCKLT